MSVEALTVGGSLPLLNESEATFECTFGRGCDGLCCKNGRPALYPDEAEVIEANLPRFLPHLRPEARAVVEKMGHLNERLKQGLPMVRVVDSWCVFFNQGCVLHKVGALEGDRLRYKPVMCALFPLERDEDGNWYVRQWGYLDEKWDLPCLNPAATSLPAVESLQEEIALAERCMLPANEPAEPVSSK
jgi:hypothetical protein